MDTLTNQEFFMKINPELISNKPTHTHKGVKVKVFTKNGKLTSTAEIMEGPDKSKWTTVSIQDLIEL